MNQEPLNFDDLTPIEIPVKYQGKDYLLKEATGGASVQYRNAISDKLEIGQDGKVVRTRGLHDREIMLVSLCLVDTSGKPVPRSTIEKFPAKMLTKLFEKAQQISGLSDTEETVEDLTTQRDEINLRIEELKSAEEAKGNPTTVSTNTGSA